MNVFVQKRDLSRERLLTRPPGELRRSPQPTGFPTDC